MKDKILNSLYDIVYQNNRTPLMDLLNINPETDDLMDIIATFADLTTRLMTNREIVDTPYWDTDKNQLVIMPLIVTWMDPIMARPVIICAANLLRGPNDTNVIIPIPRHGGKPFNNILATLKHYNEADDPMFKMAYNDCQGFVDQFGNYYTRSQAMLLQRLNMQPFNYKRNGGGSDTVLFSEGKY